MAKRKNEIDVKLLLYAIQRTGNFENLLSRRFIGVTLEESHDNLTKTERRQSQVMSIFFSIYNFKFVKIFT